MRLSLMMIAKNESRDLPRCLQSVGRLADEVVIVDGGSTDDTRDIAEKFGARVFSRTFDGFGPQKQFGLSQCRGEWVLNLDADETVTPQLAKSLQEALVSGTSFDGFRLAYENIFLGRPLRFGGCGGEKHVRLFRREKAHYPARPVHESVEVSGPIGDLKGALRHESYASLAEYLEKFQIYTGLIARGKWEKGNRFSISMHLRLPWEFFHRYVLKAGFLDGNEGFIYAALSAFYAWMKHLRLIDEARSRP